MNIEEEITEEMVEGIYCESQYKIETIPGYAEAFKRATEYFRKCLDDNYKPSDQEKEEFGLAMFELYYLEFMYRAKK